MSETEFEPSRPSGIMIGSSEGRRRAISYGCVLGIVALAALAAPVWAAVHGFGLVEISGFCAFYVVMSIGQGVALHRYFCHRSFETSTAGRVLLAILAIMSMQGPIIAWVADHRRHHAHTDRCGDTHSPHFDSSCHPLEGWRGLWHAQLGWLFDQSFTDPKIYASDMTDDRLLRILDDMRLVWYALSIAILPALWAVAFGGDVIGTILIAGCFRAFVFSQSILALNSLAHTRGYQRFDQAGTSRNNALVALLTLGEGWHNNHHRFPRSAHVGVAWYEVDPLGAIINGCEALGLVWNVRRIPARFLAGADAKASPSAPVQLLQRPRS